MASPRICIILVVYGRAATTRSWARRNRAAATIFIALVICRMFLTARTRRLRSCKLGIFELRIFQLRIADCGLPADAGFGIERYDFFKSAIRNPQSAIVRLLRLLIEHCNV